MTEEVAVKIPKDLYEKIKKHVEESGGEFKTVEDFVRFVLEEALSEEEEEVYSPEHPASYSESPHPASSAALLWKASSMCPKRSKYLWCLLVLFGMARIYCWVLERVVEVNDDCKMRFGRGDGTVSNVCPWKNSRACPLRIMKGVSGGSGS